MIGDRGRALLCKKEQCRLAAYLDTNGTPTIGWGRTAGVRMGDTCTYDEADKWLDEDTAAAERAVDDRVTAKLTESMRDALVVFVYNVGSGSFHGSTLLRLLNRKDYRMAAREFPLWDNETIAGKKVPNRGLLIRRFQEAALFATDPWPI